MRQTCIIDYGMSNLGSIYRSFEECGADVNITDSPEDLYKARQIVLPGVGAFKDGMAHLRDKGWVDVLKHCIIDRKTPILGICLGMQLLMSQGTEGGQEEGLGLISGTVEPLIPTDKAERIPHIGWNEVNATKETPLLEKIELGCDFYFVHSYHVNVDNRDDVIAVTPYCGTFVSAIAKEHIFGVQFHPEKSQLAGFQVIKNFLNM